MCPRAFETVLHTSPALCTPAVFTVASSHMHLVHSYALSIACLCIQPFCMAHFPLVNSNAGLSSVLLAVQACGSFLTVTASMLPVSKKRKREGDPHCDDSTTQPAANIVGAQSVPASTGTATSSAADGTSALQSGTCASPADALTASASKVGQSHAPAAPPFPLEHYRATAAQMQAANYPLPVLANGQKHPPLGFVAACDSGEEHSGVPAWLRLCAYQHTIRRLCNRSMSDP